ncbi:unnamed protein product [Brassica oleracea]
MVSEASGNGSWLLRPARSPEAETLQIRSAHVFWSKVVWFKENIPWNSFITWLALLRRLPTQDRLIRWGLTGPAECTFNLYRDASPLILRM